MTELTIDQAIAWDSSYVWVNMSCWLRGDGFVSEGSGRLQVRRDDGMRLEVGRDELERDYMTIEPDRAWKPRYRPVKANYVPEATVFKTRDGERLAVEAGGAILRREDGRYAAVGAAEYMSCYTVVGFPGTPYPEMPFTPAQSA